MEEGTLGFSLETCKFLDRRGQNIHVALVVPPYKEEKQQDIHLCVI